MPRWPKKKKRPGVDEYGRSSLWHHAADGNEAGVASEVERGADLNGGDDAGYTALHVAVQNGHVNVVQQLLAFGANPNATDEHGNGPLWTAVMLTREHRERIIALLLKAGAAPDHVNAHGRSPSQMAEAKGGIYAALFAEHRRQ